MKIHVQIVQGPASNQSFYVEKDSRFSVGRGESANFQIEEDELLSREHFVLEFDGNQLLLTDLGSTNGTFVNGHALTHRPVILKDNQQFVAGRVSRFVVHFPEQTENKAEAKTTPSIAAPPAVSETPTPRLPNPPRNPNTNFGASIYSADAGGPEPPNPMSPTSPAPPASSNNEGGNFSQSVVTGFSDSAGPEQGSLLYSNPPSPTPSIAQPPKKRDAPASGLPDRGDLPPLPDQMVNEDYGSIAAPGGKDFPEFPPLGGAEPKVPLTQVPPEEERPMMPLPGFEPQQSASDMPAPGEDSPAESPFASIHQPVPAPTPGPAPIEVPAEPPATSSTPELRQEVPTDQPPETGSPFQASGSIYAPGQDPRAPASEVPIAPASHSSIGSAGSIGLPHQMPVAQPRRETQAPIKADLPPGKIGFQVRQFDNGLFAFSGTDIEDLERIKGVLNAQFESVFCAHLTRAEIEPVAEAAPEQAQQIQPDLGASPFEDIEDEAPQEKTESGGDSPFEALDEEKPEPAAEEPKKVATPKIGTPLFSWFPKECQWENPVLLTDAEFKYPLKDLWQMDALVCIFGSSSKQVIDHCHDLVRMNLRTGKQGSMFGFCWPTVLDSTLETQSEKAIGRIFAGGIAAFFLEDPQEEFAWNIISRNDMTQSLIDSGLVLLPG